MMRDQSKDLSDWVEDLDDNTTQPWLVLRQGPFISIRQRAGGTDDWRWVLIHEDDIEGFLRDIHRELVLRK